MKTSIFAVAAFALVAFILSTTATPAYAQPRGSGHAAYGHTSVPRDRTVVSTGNYRSGINAGYSNRLSAYPTYSTYERGYGYTNGWYGYGYVPAVMSFNVYDSVYDPQCGCYINQPFIATWDGYYGGYTWYENGRMHLRRR